ncbi:SLC13 family permease [Anaerotruncus rubiinfantis]|uniref:SLC13 family permease n=1 Tax=Anaerotruncus rubiinfantis TaxID=1720200 RepID=UPI001898811D|nr:SLC13 family permease [Anaerotruncus rubiinfantis]
MRKSFVKKCLIFFQNETVLVAAFLCAAISMLFIPPDAQYMGYIDLRVLCLLFCLMEVVAGFQECGLFIVLAQKLLSGRKRFRMLSFVLVTLPFFSSMLITNDVALITFVPFAILVLTMIDRTEYLIRIVALQTIAANLGSMATPVGNPQNLFLYAKFSIPTSGFFAVMAPLTLLSLAALAAAALAVNGEIIEVHFPARQTIRSPGRLALFCGLFALCLLSVFHLLHYGLLLLIVLLALGFFARGLFRRADYGLLMTFACFFVFAGNIGRIGAVREFLAGILTKSAAATSILASQAISNVPAAVLLSGFTDDWRGLLVGTNIGGLGTLIASLASLISFQLYRKSAGARPFRYLAFFTAANLAGLLFLLLAARRFGML